MLDFPSTGLVAGVTTVTGPSGQEWLWDGVKWTAVGGGGGGGPQMGVIDGSDAAPGQIGEIITKSDFTTDSSSDAFNGYGYFTGTYWWVLPAGDWDVDGYLTFNSVELAATDVWFDSISVNVNGDELYDHSPANLGSILMEGWVFSDSARAAVDIGVVGSLGYLVLPKFRANAADHAPGAPSGGGIGIDIGIGSPGGFTLGIYMRARRMR